MHATRLGVLAVSAVLGACVTVEPGGGSGPGLIQPIRPPQGPVWKGLPHGTVGSGARGKVKLKDLGKPVDPPAVAKAMEHRELEPGVALSMLREAWLAAVKKKDVTLAAYALDRSGDVLMDLRELDGSEALLTWADAAQGVKQRANACALARDEYLRAYGLAELTGDRRLIGRVAHDVGWALERCSGPAEEVISWYETALAHRLAIGDAGGVRFSANNLGRYQSEHKWRRLELYELAAEGAKVAKDWSGLRKIEGNLARLWFFSRDAKWLDRDAGLGKDEEYAHVPLTGEVRRQFLVHLAASLEAGGRADESAATVCEGLQVPGPDCDEWGGHPPEVLFPEGCCQAGPAGAD
ncbi:MAG: hypothetical protein AMXMBFR34_48180 [Myxococcaceae bacterium]